VQSHRFGLLACLLGSALLPAQASPPPARTVAVTFDDLPFVAYGLGVAGVQQETARLVGFLRARHVPAIGFVNEDKLQVKGERDARVGLLEAWLDAGLELGNHNYGHVGFQTTPLDRYQEAVLKGEVVTRALLAARGRAPRYYRHTFTQTGPTREAKDAFETFLREHGYTVAPFTVENADYVFAKLYADARRAGDDAAMGRVRDAYLEHFDAAFAFFEGESRDLFGREIAQILLIHANELNAESIEALVDRLSARGYRFVSLDQALADDAYRSADGYIGPTGPSWLHRWRAGRGEDIRPALSREPDPPRWILERFRSGG
jgi:peptidoglycan/xylan/chitin deacetylase (PgdA/CDA1 family)